MVFWNKRKNTVLDSYAMRSVQITLQCFERFISLAGATDRSTDLSPDQCPADHCPGINRRIVHVRVREFGTSSFSPAHLLSETQCTLILVI